MVKFIDVSSGSVKREGVRAHNIKRQFRIGPVSLQFATVVLIALASLFYLTQSGRVSDKSFQLRELEAKKDVLSTQNDRLRLEAARLQSLQELKNSQVVKDMVAPARIDYLPASDSNVAKK
jgi:hypothetical protein